MPKLDTHAWKSLLVIIALGVAGCASSASNLKPDQLEDNEAAFFGQVTVLNGEEDVTEKCYVEFTDSNESRKSYVSLDSSGYVFGAVEPGPTYLSMALCTLGGLVKYNATYNARDIRFDIPGKGKMAYFGHVTIDLKFDDSGMTAISLLGGALANNIAASAKSGNGAAKVQNNFDAASKEYEKRFGKAGGSLRPVPSLATLNGASERTPASGQK